MSTDKPKKNKHHIGTYIVPKNTKNISVILCGSTHSSKAVAIKPIVISLDTYWREIEVIVEFTE